MEAAERARVGLRHRPDQRLGLHDRRQHRRERGGQEGGPLGHLHRQPALLAHRDAGRHVDRPPRRPPAAQDPSGRPVRWRVEDGAGRDVRTIALAGRADPQRRPLEGHHEQGARRRSPACRRRGPTASSPRRGFVLHPQYEATGHLLPRVLRRRHGRGERGDPRAGARVSATTGDEALLALEHFDEQYVRAIDYRVKAPRDGTPPGGAAHRPRRARPRRRSSARLGRLRAHPRATTPTPQLFVARDAGGGDALLGRPQAPRRDRAAHERLQAQRGCRAAARRRSPSSARWVDAVNLEEERAEPARAGRGELRDFFEEAPPQRGLAVARRQARRAPSTCARRRSRRSPGRTPRQMRGGTAVEGLLADAARSVRAATARSRAGIEGDRRATCAHASSCSLPTCTPGTAMSTSTSRSSPTTGR